MIKTLRISFSLRNTYRVNSILYSIRQIPLIKNIFLETIYRMQGFKVLANVLSVFGEIISAFLGKILYFLLMIMGASLLYGLPEETDVRLVLHILVFLSILGSIINTYMFDPSKDKYYAMILLGMDAREYTLVNYFYAILKVLVGFAFCSFVFGFAMGLSVWQCLLIPFFVAGLKITAAAKSLRDYEKNGKVKNENNIKGFYWTRIAALLVLLAATYGLPVLGWMLPEVVSTAVMCLGVISGIVFLRKIWTFKSYRAMYKELLTETDVFADKDAVQKATQEQSRSSISDDSGIASSRKGFEYLNELFIRRHQKLLWKPAKRIAVAVLLLIAVVVALVMVFPEVKASVNWMLLALLPNMLFVMYIINRGTGFTQALFVNCDHCLLTYSFYKKPGSILKLFQIRLREIIKINLMPAAVIGAGLVFLLYVSGGTDNLLNYVVLFVSVICMSVFFSVHYLTLYYLLQPYNAGTEIKSGMYKIITWATYFVCYMMINVKMSTLVFGVMTIVFCVVYCIVANILVYLFAPKTFRIRV